MSNNSNPNSTSSRYLFMQDSDQADSEGNFYPDICTFKIEEFDYTEKVYEERLRQGDVYRLDILIYDLYKDFFLYDELTLWLNNRLSLSKEDIGTTLNLPDKKDFDSFYIKNIVSK